MANEKRLIEANVFVRDLTAMKSVYDAISLDGMIKALKDAPTVDAVEVVRCRDCVYWDGRGYDGRCEAPNNGLIRDYTNYDDFCSYGERKEGDGDE